MIHGHMAHMRSATDTDSGSSGDGAERECRSGAYGGGRKSNPGIEGQDVGDYRWVGFAGGGCGVTDSGVKSLEYYEKCNLLVETRTAVIKRGLCLLWHEHEHVACACALRGVEVRYNIVEHC